MESDAELVAQVRRGEVEANETADSHTHAWIDNEYLLSLIARLPEPEGVLIGLRYFDGHSMAEIAAISARPLGTVTKQLSRAMAAAPCGSPTAARSMWASTNQRLPTLYLPLSRTSVHAVATQRCGKGGLAGIVKSQVQLVERRETHPHRSALGHP
jgi:Sigma-70, region 4